MTEAEWLACHDSERLFGRFWERGMGRKHRLYACACARRVWHTYAEDVCREAIDLAEAFADGLAEESILIEAASLLIQRQTAYDYGYDSSNADWMRYAGFDVAAATAWPSADFYSIRSGIRDAASMAVGARHPDMGIDSPDWAGLEPLIQAERVAQQVFLRDIFGNPFRPVIFLPEWRTSTAVVLASQMYESRDFGAMPILADAIQEAGCDNGDILSHCRDPKPVHVRGCWVVDLVLGKE